jgi:quinohemoprotein amine dehydrogenase
VTDALVISKCAPCHTKDDKSNLTRISWSRTSPEGWQQVIKRMVRSESSGAETGGSAVDCQKPFDHARARPEEAKPVMFIPEQRMIDEPLPSDVMKDTCASCHPLARAASWRGRRKSGIC